MKVSTLAAVCGGERIREVEPEAAAHSGRAQ
jgi:hypothetical protein